MNSIAGFIASVAIALTVCTAFWVYLKEMLFYNEGAGVLIVILAGLVCHAGLTGVTLYHLKGQGIFDINAWLKRRKRKKKK